MIRALPCFVEVNFINIKISSLALAQSFHYPSANDAALNDMTEYVKTFLYNHNKTKH